METFEEALELYGAIQEHRRNALMLLGVGYFNHNRIKRSRQMVEQRSAEVQEILGVVKKLLTGDYDGADVNRVAELLVKHDKVMANGISTVIGFELEDLHRRAHSAD